MNLNPDPLLLVLGLTQTCFEGSMYLFVFLWVPSLQEVSITYPADTPPLGYIFSSFMISMMLGSLLYTAIISYSLPSTSTTPAESSITLHAKLSSLVCSISALALAASIRSDNERIRFWAFCAFEACVGMYYPVQGMLRGSLISNEHRATVSAVSFFPSTFQSCNGLRNSSQLSHLYSSPHYSASHLTYSLSCRC